MIGRSPSGQALALRAEPLRVSSLRASILNAVGRSVIMWFVRRTDWFRIHPLTPWPSNVRPMKRLANRYMPLFRDEIQRGDDSIHLPLPWWAPCNLLLHHWLAHDDGNEFHDHPRWSITIPLRGELTEKTPWGEKTLRPGSIVFRSPRYIHGFRVKPEHSARTWTLFVVGRRRRCQNTYIVTRRVEAAERKGLQSEWSETRSGSTRRAKARSRQGCAQ